MRKLKLQMQISLDGFVATEKNSGNFNWDDEVRKFSINNLENVDTIFLGRKTAESFIPFWAGIAANPKHDDYKIGKLLTDIPKIVFSKKLKSSKWKNVLLVNRELKTAIKRLKAKKGKDIIVYGGHSFVSSLIQQRLVDEFYFLVNPLAIGSGKTIFNSLKGNLLLRLKKCKPFACGTVLMHYEKRK